MISPAVLIPIKIVQFLMPLEYWTQDAQKAINPRVQLNGELSGIQMSFGCPLFTVLVQFF